MNVLYWLEPAYKLTQTSCWQKIYPTTEVLVNKEEYQSVDKQLQPLIMFTSEYNNINTIIVKKKIRTDIRTFKRK